MQLVSMDVDRVGNHHPTRFGPFSPGLNAIFGTRGSGKSTLLHWLRQMACEDGHDIAGHHPRQITSPYFGELEFRQQNHRYRLHVDTHGRVNFVSQDRSTGPQRTFYRLTSEQRAVLEGTATAQHFMGDETALESLAHSLGIPNFHNEVERKSRTDLAERENVLQSRLASLQVPTFSKHALLMQRQELEHELAKSQGATSFVARDDRQIEFGRLDNRYIAVDNDLRATMAQIDRLERELSAARAELQLLDHGHPTVEVGETYLQQLQELDARLDRWRQTLKDLKTYRERVEHNASEAQLDQQVGDQLSATKSADPRAALRSLEAQIVHTREQLDDLVTRYQHMDELRRTDTAARRENPREYRVLDRGAKSYGPLYDDRKDTYNFSDHVHFVPDTAGLAENLRSMQRDLYEVCQQLSRHESMAASETLKKQSLQLSRCESELLQSVEQLIQERANLLRRIADDRHLSVDQLTLAFGQWCQCTDHPHLHQWLMEEQSHNSRSQQVDATARQQLVDDISRLEGERKRASLHAEQCRRQLRDSDAQRRSIISTRNELPQVRRPAEIELDLSRIVNDLRAYDERERVETELLEIRKSLAESTHSLSNRDSFGSRGSFSQLVDQHVRAIMGSANGRFQRAFHSIPTSIRHRYDLIDGEVSEIPGRFEIDRSEHGEVPGSIVRLAMRLAIMETMRARGQHVPLLLDQTIDGLSHDLQRSTIAYLSEVAARGQQILILTDNSSVVGYVQTHHGWVGSLQASQTHPGKDVNQELLGFANESELEKWHSANVHHGENPNTTSWDYYLSSDSAIEMCPALGETLSAELRALGLRYVGDLIAADPVWLSSAVGTSRVAPEKFARLQAQCRLLCGVRGLRPFDARLLVGVGIGSVQQLAQMSPTQLLDRVESFLSTDSGRRLMHSGNSHELSRITTWIAAAGAPQRFQSANGSRFNGHGNEYDRFGVSRPSTFGRQDNRNSTARSERNGYEETGRRRRQESRLKNAARAERSRTGGSSTSRKRERVRIAGTSNNSSSSNSGKHRFYLELSSPVVDAPSIGPRMASRLEQCGITTVQQLINATPEHLAERLNIRRVEAATIRSWQEQARLVCRIPNLRGHDAQLLVACNLTSPESLATMNAETVLAAVSAVAHTADGQRMLRGSKEPDLTEVRDWIAWAAASRSLNAA
ncbi:MAG: DUF4332 domain-containing protein [Planctomycetales bacterium]|nr:DUF4332 domain-containing protein [Planctomycetales bacterium]